MKRFLSAAVAVVSMVLLAGVALAYMGPGRMGMGHGHMMGPGMMGGAAAPCGCPGMAAAAQTRAPAQITQEDAKALVEQYAKEYLPGFTVETVVPFAGRRMLAYQAELKGPNGETRTLHVNPWGTVMPFPRPRGPRRGEGRRAARGGRGCLLSPMESRGRGRRPARGAKRIAGDRISR